MAQGPGVLMAVPPYSICINSTDLLSCRIQVEIQEQYHMHMGMCCGGKEVRVGEHS